MAQIGLNYFFETPETPDCFYNFQYIYFLLCNFEQKKYVKLGTENLKTIPFTLTFFDLDLVVTFCSYEELQN